VTGFTADSTINVANLLSGLGYTSISETTTAASGKLLYQSDSSFGLVYEGLNLVEDGSFSGTDTWTGNAYNVVDGVNVANVETAGDAYAVNLSTSVELTAGQVYTLMFDASGEAGRTMLAGIGLSGDPWYSNTEEVTLSADSQTYVLHLTAADLANTGYPFGGDSASRVLFDMGADTGAVNIDNVRLFEGALGTATDGDGVIELVTDGTFDTADSWSGNAYNPVDGVNVADVATAGNPWDANLSGTVNLVGGQLYTLSFDVSGEEGRTILAGIGESAGNYWAHTQEVTVTAETQTVTLHLIAMNAGNPDGGEYFGGETSRVLFDMGADAGAVNIDNVSLVAGHLGTATGDAAEVTTIIASDLGDNELRADARLVDTDDDGVNDSTLVTLLYDADSSVDSIEYAYRQMYLDGDVTDTVLSGGAFNYDALVLNAQPVITSTAVTTVDEDSAYSYALTATDAEGTDVTLSVTVDGSAIAEDSWLSFSNNTLSGTPENGDVGTYSVVVTAQDEDGQSSEQAFTLTVANTNDAPVLDVTPVTTAAQGSEYSLTFSVTDVDVGDETDGSLTVNGVDLLADDYDGSSWLTFTDNGNDTFTLTGTPTIDEAGTTQSIVITASDGEETVEESFDIAVSSPTQYLSFNIDQGYLQVFIDVETLSEQVSDLTAYPYFYGGSFEFGDTDGTPFDTDVFVTNSDTGVIDSELGRNTKPFNAAAVLSTSETNAESGNAKLVLGDTTTAKTFTDLLALDQAADGTVLVSEIELVDSGLSELSMQINGTFVIADVGANSTDKIEVDQIAINIDIV
jgi:hypothetical protein